MEPVHSIFEDDPDMAELVASFVAELPARIRSIEGCLGGGDLEELQRLAHQLKGAGGGYGFPQITDLAASLEQALKEGADEAVVKERTHDLCELLGSIRGPEAG